MRTKKWRTRKRDRPERKEETFDSKYNNQGIINIIVVGIVPINM